MAPSQVPADGAELLLNNTSHHPRTSPPERVETSRDRESSPSSLISLPSPWLPERGPRQSEITAASKDGGHKNPGDSGIEATNDHRIFSPGAGIAAANMGLGEYRLKDQRSSSVRKSTTISPERRLPTLLPNFSTSVPAARITLPPVANVVHNPAQNYPPTSHRYTPARPGPVALATSMALAPLEQQMDLAKLIVAHTHGHLSPVEKNFLLTIRDIRQASDEYWKTLSLMDAVSPNVPEAYYKRSLQMRAAYMWARNCEMMPYADLVGLLKLPPGFLRYWIRRFAGV